MDFLSRDKVLLIWIKFRHFLYKKAWRGWFCFRESVRQKTEAKPFFGFYSSSIIEAKEAVPFHFVLRSVHRFHISPDCLDWHLLKRGWRGCFCNKKKGWQWLTKIVNRRGGNVAHLFHISPDRLHRHRDEADDGVCNGQVEHQVVHVGPAGW